MNDVMDDAMDAEFDTVAEWTAEVADHLGWAYRVAAGCRGSGSPAALDWLVERLQLDAGTTMIDCGAGVGGPSAYARGSVGVRPVLVDPEAGACRAARRLFELPIVRADGVALPFATDAFDAGWALGVLCTTAAQTELLAELNRILRPGAALGLLVFVATGEPPEGKPRGNHFPTPERLSALLAEAGLSTEHSVELAELEPEPPEWDSRVAAVEDELDRRHHDDPRWQTAQEQAAIMGRLLESGQVAGRLLSLRTRM